MIISLLLVGLSVISLVTGDDSTTVTGGDSTTSSTSTSHATTTYVAPGFWALAPTTSPTYGMDDIVTFKWNATVYDLAGYFCKTNIGPGFITNWIQPTWASTTSNTTTYEASSLGRSLSSLTNYTAWPATCCFAMSISVGRKQGAYTAPYLFYVQSTTTTSSPTSVIAQIPTTVTYIVTSIEPTESPVQPTSTQSTSTNKVDPNLSQSAKAGIIIGCIGGATIAFLLVMLRKAARRRTSPSEGLLSGFEEAIAPVKASFRGKIHASEPASSSIKGADGAQRENNVSDPVVGVFELDSQQRYGDGPHELPDK